MDIYIPPSIDEILSKKLIESFGVTTILGSSGTLLLFK